MLKRIICSMLFASLVNASAFAQSTQPATGRTDVPVKAVVLFSSGVGYFEHFGSVRGDSQTELRFKTSQINDILKSLVLQDLDNGKVSTITYPSQDPISKTLRSFQVDITNNPPLADLLNQLRGAKVTVQSQGENVTGTVLGVEKKRKAVEKGEPVETSVLNVLNGATIRKIELDSINSLTLDDAQLQEELTKALTALAQSRDQDKKPVTINFAGQGERRVRIGYVVETPVWKTSYRLLMDDKNGKLQGWAIVENQTESDWNNVQLSLVSGRPISFIMDLYQPMYIPRPVVQPELFASLRPQTYDEGMTRRDEYGAFNQPQAAAAQAPSAPGQANFGGTGGAGAARGGGRGGRGGGGGGAGGPAFQLQQQAQQQQQGGALFSGGNTAGEAEDARLTDMSTSVQSVASASKIGELFQYTVGNVTLPRQKSAMLPIITDDIEVERLSIYNASVLPKNPLNGARVKNTTDKHLLGGPITVIDGASYAGDARIDNVPPGQERLLSYGIDLQMLVDPTKNKQESTITSGKISKGVLQISRRFVATQDYLAENKSDKDKTLIIEHPIKQGWKLTGMDNNKPIETTQTLYRFKGVTPAKKGTKLTVTEEMVQPETIAILPADPGTLFVYSNTGEIPKPVRDALGKAIQFKNAMVDTDRQIAEHDKQVTEITQEQVRIRENMRTIDRTAQYYTRLLTKLNEQETDLEKLAKEKEDLIKKRDDQRKALEDYVAGLDVG